MTLSTHLPALRRHTLPLLLFGAVALSGCSALVAQNPGGPLSPVNAVADESSARLMLQGHDVVAYFTQGRHAQGLPEFTVEHQGVTFRFARAEHRALFLADPARYLPQYGGYCANGMVYGIPWGGDADSWRIVDGRLFIFGGPQSQAGFELDLAGNTRLADHYWATEAQGTNSFWQRTKRLVFRVPHYKSGDDLARAIAASRQKTSP
jgi:hypothetical protein